MSKHPLTAVIDQAKARRTTYDVTCRRGRGCEKWFVDEIPARGDTVRYGPFGDEKKALSCVDFLRSCDELVTTLKEQGA